MRTSFSLGSSAVNNLGGQTLIRSAVIDSNVSTARTHVACCARFASLLAHVSFRLTDRLNTSLPPTGSENCLLTNVPFLIHY